MKWTYWPVTKGSCEMWQLDHDDKIPIRGHGELHIVNYQNHGWGEPGPYDDLLQGWCVQVSEIYSPLAVIPYDTPEEELKARAIAEWRMS